MHGTGPRGVRIELVRLDGHEKLRVTMRNVLVGAGYFTSVEAALETLRRYGIDEEDLEFDYSMPEPAVGEDAECE